MKVGSLFSGIGGFDLGLERAGMEVVWQVENEKNCNQILEKHWPKCRRYLNVQEVGRYNLQPVDLVCGGFPCQDLSVAGRRAGLDGERSGLWYEFARIIDELAPKWVLIENVPGLLSSAQGNDFRIIVQWLVERGYGVAWRVLNSQYSGLAQRRKRVFIVGSFGTMRSVQVLFESACVCGDSPKGREKGEEVAGSLGGGSQKRGWCNDLDRSGAFVSMALNAKGGSGRIDAESETFITDARGLGDGELCPSLVGDHMNRITDYTPMVTFAQNTRDEVRIQGDGNICGALAAEPGMKQTTYVAQQVQWSSGGGEVLNDTAQALRSGAEHNYQFVQHNLFVRRLTPTECERLQGFPDNWTMGLSDSARYRALGNAVSVPVVEWIGKRIMEVDRCLRPS